MTLRQAYKLTLCFGIKVKNEKANVGNLTVWDFFYLGKNLSGKRLFHFLHNNEWEIL